MLATKAQSGWTAGNHAVYNGPEEGGAGGLGVPVANVPSQVRSLNPREIS